MLQTRFVWLGNLSPSNEAKGIEMTKNTKATELNDAALEAANGGVNINNDYMPMADGVIINGDHRMTNSWAPVNDAVNINNDYRMSNTWMPVTDAVNINNDY